MRGATAALVADEEAYCISTHAPLAGRDRRHCSTSAAGRISTHAPLAGRDNRLQYASNQTKLFQPTRPLRGATKTDVSRSCWTRFQPTRPLRGATGQATEAAAHLAFQPTRPLRGATRLTLPPFGRIAHFNPRAPCGARLQLFRSVVDFLLFQPTRPLRGATAGASLVRVIPVFQPTRPLRGATSSGTARTTTYTYFNPRAPCGARRKRDNEARNRL